MRTKSTCFSLSIALSKGVALGLTLTKSKTSSCPLPPPQHIDYLPRKFTLVPGACRGDRCTLLFTDNEYSPAFRRNSLLSQGVLAQPLFLQPLFSFRLGRNGGGLCPPLLSPGLQSPCSLDISHHLLPQSNLWHLPGPGHSQARCCPIADCPLPVPFPQHHGWYLGDTEMRPLSA